MYYIALKMLIGDRPKFIGMVLSLSFSTIIIIQQTAIFLGLMRRTYSFITDTPQAEIWVMNPSVKMIDDMNPVRSIELFRIRSIEGVSWAMPFYKGVIRARLPDGQFQTCNLIGIDAGTFIGGPHTMIAGALQDLRKPFSIIVDQEGAGDKLAHKKGGNLHVPLSIGDEIELNDTRAQVVGICKISRTFRSEPIVYTTFDRALHYVPAERKQLSYILVKTDHTVSVPEMCRRIQQVTGLSAYTKKDFEQLTFDYYIQNTGIPINFGIAVLLGLLVGAAVTSQIFFNFTTDILPYLGLFNVVGASHVMLAKVAVVQALCVAICGWSFGAGAASLIGFLTSSTQLAFYMPWWLFIGSGLLIMVICMISALISIIRIIRIELWMLFKQ